MVGSQSSPIPVGLERILPLAVFGIFPEMKKALMPNVNIGCAGGCKLCLRYALLNRPIQVRCKVVLYGFTQIIEGTQRVLWFHSVPVSSSSVGGHTPILLLYWIWSTPQ